MHTRIRKFNTRTTYPEQKLDNDLCQTVVAQGRMVFVRGQVGQDLDSSLSVGVGDAEAQAEQAMSNIKLLLSEAGATLEQICKVTIYLTLVDDRITDISFQGSGCAISTASASILTETLKGKTRKEAEEIFEDFHSLVTGQPVKSGGAALGKLAVFSGVCEFPVRVKCASLAWHTLHSALEGSPAVASSE